MTTRPSWMPSREVLTGFLVALMPPSLTTLDEQLDLLEEEFARTFYGLASALTHAKTERDRWFAAAGERQDELNEAHRALAWVAGSLPFEDRHVPVHLAPPEFVARQVMRAKVFAGTLPPHATDEAKRAADAATPGDES